MAGGDGQAEISSTIQRIASRLSKRGKRKSGSGLGPAPFEQNEIPLKNSVESRDCAHPKITGAKLASVSTWSQLRLSRPSRIRPIFHHHVRLSKFHAALLASPPEQPRPPAFHPG